MIYEDINLYRIIIFCNLFIFSFRDAEAHWQIKMFTTCNVT